MNAAHRTAPTAWLPALADLIHARPELLGVGVAGVADLSAWSA